MSCRRRVLIRMETPGTTAQERRTPINAPGLLGATTCCLEANSGRSRETGRITISTITLDTRIPAARRDAPTERIIRDRIRARLVVVGKPASLEAGFLSYGSKNPYPVITRRDALPRTRALPAARTRRPPLHNQFVIPIWFTMKA